MPDGPGQAGFAAGRAAPPETLGARIERERERLFVGRGAERDRFQHLTEDEPGGRIVVVSGPPGIGKTLLAQRLLATARQHRIRTAGLDAHLLQEATPRALEASVEEVVARLDPTAPVNVLCIDNVERIAAMEHWLRSTLPRLLPSNTLLMLVGRWQPPTDWRADPALGSVLEHWALETLSADEVADYLKRRELTAAQRAAVMEFAHGHPLAVALAADHLARTGEHALQPGRSGDLIQRLIDWLLSDLEDGRYRDCLEVAATLHFANEPALQALVPEADAGELYRWLATQPYMEYHDRGLLMHELVRTVIIEDLRRRNLPRHHRLIRRAADFFMNEVQRSSPESVHLAVAEWAYTVRWEPYMRRYYDMSAQTHYLDRARGDESQALADIVERHEGPEARRWFDYWRARQPDLLHVVRDDAGRPAGLMLGIILGRGDMQSEQTDPAVARYLSFLSRHTPLERGEKALLVRFIGAADTYQQTGPAFTQLEMKVNSLVFLPGLTYFAVVCDRARDWASSAENANFRALPGCRIETERCELELRGCDLKAEPPLIWIRNTVERMLGTGMDEDTATAAPITRERFADAVLDALRGFRDDERLARNLLLTSQRLARDAGECRPTAADLRRVIKDAVEKLNRRFPAKRLPEIIEHSYFRDDSKQISAAAALNISESTYRRRLRRAEAEIVAHLWAQETGATRT